MFATRVFLTAHRFLFQNLSRFFALSVWFIALTTALFVYEDVRGKSLGMAATMGRAFMEAFFAIFWHRYYLLGVKETTMKFPPSDCSDEQKQILLKCTKRFLYWSLGGTLALVLAMLILLFTPAYVAWTDDTELNVIILGGIVFILLSPLFFRILPFFPALAVGNANAKITEAWQITKGATVRIWFSYMSALLPFFLLILATGIALDPDYGWLELPSPVNFVVYNVALATLSYLLLAIGVSANSEIFRRLTGFVAPAA